MIVCSCTGVTDRTIGAVLATGASSIDEVGAACGAGTRCGGCWPHLQALIDEHVAVRATPHVAA